VTEQNAISGTKNKHSKQGDIVMPMKFRFRWIPFIAATTAAAIGVSLGQWQTRRAIEKESIEAKMSERSTAAPIVVDSTPLTGDDVEYRRVRVRGKFVSDWNIYLDNRPYKGSAGFYVLTPMRIEGSRMQVIVARGWVKRDIADRTKLPEIALPDGIIEIEGLARRNAGHVLQLGNAEPLRPGSIVQNLEPSTLAQASGLPTQPFVIEQLGDTQDGLVRDWPRPSAGAEKHRAYAFQWYALAAMAIVFFVVTGLKRGRQQATK
jgi:surfeit locus 1 family protein